MAANIETFLGQPSWCGLSAGSQAATCLAGEWTALTDGEGHYELTIPGYATEGCSTVSLVAFANGFMYDLQEHLIVDLRDDPTADFWLNPYYYVWVPMGLK